jgi:hypothetical protein
MNCSSLGAGREETLRTNTDVSTIPGPVQPSSGGRTNETKVSEPVSGVAFVQYYGNWWEGKTVQKNVARKFWHKP